MIFQFFNHIVQTSGIIQLFFDSEYFLVCFRSMDPHRPKYPTIIKFLNNHNHLLECADNVKYTNVSKATKGKFISLYENGHSPYSALEMHKDDIFHEYGESEYFIRIADRSSCPDLQWCYR